MLIAVEDYKLMLKIEVIKEIGTANYPNYIAIKIVKKILSMIMLNLGFL